MREAFFILFVVALLFGFTVIRYRKRIAGMIGFARILKDARESAGQNRVTRNAAQTSVQLVNCAKCGVWVPENKARKLGNQSYCSDDCIAQARA